mmetsp:Transcript_2967/g.7313  ORF Transcript_2967/g.7313 Transcript_2967/m.7313 type:complete len:1380 (+) Transcript_2967:669-4808(+)
MPSPAEDHVVDVGREGRDGVEVSVSSPLQAKLKTQRPRSVDGGDPSPSARRSSENKRVGTEKAALPLVRRHSRTSRAVRNVLVEPALPASVPVTDVPDRPWYSTRRHGYPAPAGGAGLGVPHGADDSYQGIISPQDEATPQAQYEAANNEAWKSFQTFRAEEERRRHRNGNSDSAGRLFVSHCWRLSEQQARKRQFISELSVPVQEGGKGLTYWADFLDLQCNGPVMWQRKIWEGIDACSKMVAYIDIAYLHSVNCLKEVAYALSKDKPVVLIIMDQAAWELLTVPNGAARAWGEGAWGPPLSDYAGQEFLVGEALSEGAVARLYAQLAEINLCPCRPLEEANWSMAGLLRNMCEYVTKDIAFMKEHAVLKAAAMDWDAKRRPDSQLLHPKESAKWAAWLRMAAEANMKPAPTQLQEEYVQRSLASATTTRRRLGCAGAILFLLILAGGIASVVLAIAATRAQGAAEASAAAASMWTVLGRLSGGGPQGSVPEQRALLALLDALPPALLGSHAALFRPVAAEASRAFYALAGLPMLAVGTLEALGKCQSAAWSPDGATLAAATDAPPGVRLQPVGGGPASARWLTGPTAQVFRVRWVPGDSTRLAAVDAAGKLHLWDVTSGATLELRTPLGGAPIRDLAWRPGSPATLAVADYAGGLAVCESMGTGTSGAGCERLSVQGKLTLYAIAWSPDGRLLASAGADGEVSLWSAAAPGSNHTAGWAPAGPATPVGPYLFGLEFSPDGGALAVAAGMEQRVLLFALEGNEVKASGGLCGWLCIALPSLAGASPAELQWAPSDSPAAHTRPWLSAAQRMAAAAMGWNATSWASCAGCARGDWKLCAPGDAGVPELYAADVCPSSQLKAWTALSPQEARAAGVLGFSAPAWDAAAPNSCCLRGAAAIDGPVEVSTTLAPAEIRLVELGSFGLADNSPGYVNRVALSPDGRRLASAWATGLHVWDLASASPGPAGSWATPRINDVAWSPAQAGSDLLAAAISSGDVTITNTSYGGALGPRRLAGHNGDTLHLLSQDAGTLLTASYGKLHRVDAMTGARLGEPVLTPGNDEWANELASSPRPSGPVALAVADPEKGNVQAGITGRVYLLDRDSLARTRTLEVAGEPCVTGVAWTSDGAALAATVGTPFDDTRPRGVAVWSEPTEGEEPPTPLLLQTLGFGVRAAFHASRPLLAATTGTVGVSGRCLHMWELPAGNPLPLPASLANSSNMFNLAWSGDRLAVASAEGAVHVLHGDLADPSSMSVEVLPADNGKTLAVSWSPDEQHLATGGEDGSVMIWNMARPGHGFLTAKAELGRSIFVLHWLAAGTDVIAGGVGGFVIAVPFQSTESMSAALRANLLPFTPAGFTSADAVALRLDADAVARLLDRSAP